MLLVVKAALKAVPVEQALAVGYEGDIAGEEDHFYALANPPSPAMEVSVSHAENDSMQGNGSSEITQFSQPKPSCQMTLILMTMFLEHLRSCIISFLVILWVWREISLGEAHHLV